MTLTLTEVSKSFGGVPVLENISFTLEPGKSLCVTGPSGCGKTTLLRIILCLRVILRMCMRMCLRRRRKSRLHHQGFLQYQPEARKYQEKSGTLKTSYEVD